MDITTSSQVKIETSSEGRSTEKVVIEMKNISLTNAGSFSLSATNDLSQTSEFWNCTVHSKPIFITQLEEEYVHGEGENVIMTVRVDAFPEANLVWLQNGKEINIKDSKYSFSSDKNTYTLKIKNVTRVDAAKYTAKATNEHGTASSETNLLIKCTPTFTKKLSNITVTEGETNVELTVEVDAYPRPHIKWYIDSIEIDEKRNEFRRVEDKNEFKLILKEVTTTLHGSYCCKIMNDYGKLESECLVTVQCKFQDFSEIHIS